MAENALKSLKANIDKSDWLRKEAGLMLSGVYPEKMTSTCDRGCPTDCYSGCISGCSSGCRTSDLR
jgi:hypothetical protein